MLYHAEPLVAAEYEHMHQPKSTVGNLSEALQSYISHISNDF